MRILDRITGDNSVAGFPDIYNKNNQAIEVAIGSLETNVSSLEKICKKKVDRNGLESIIEQKVNEMMGESGSLDTAEIVSLIRSVLEDYGLIGGEVDDGNLDTINNIYARIGSLQTQLEGLQSSFETKIKSVQLDMENRIAGLENTQYYPEITEIDGGQQYIMKKYKK